MKFDTLIKYVLNEHITDKIVPTFTGTRSGYVVNVVLFDERLDDIYERGRYPEVYSIEKIERSFVGWRQFDEATQENDRILILYIGTHFEQARQILLNHLRYIYLFTDKIRSRMLQEVDRLSEVQGTFKVYEDGATSQPYVSFAVEIDQGYYRSLDMKKDLQGLDTSGLEDLL
jgi:hypothetical protein